MQYGIKSRPYLVFVIHSRTCTQYLFQSCHTEMCMLTQYSAYRFIRFWTEGKGTLNHDGESQVSRDSGQ